jgi:hypothetical protein
MQTNTLNISVWKLIIAKLKTPSVFVFLIFFLFTILAYKYWIVWFQLGPFTDDVDQYYSYLVGEFIHHDLSFKFDNYYWLVPTETGQSVPKVTMGMAYMYFPFFFIANNIAYTHEFSGLGYSAPYMWFIHFGSIFYVILGLWYSRKVLLMFFSEWVTAATLLLVLFGTNLFYYTYKQSEMAHGYLFCLIAIFIFHVLRWYVAKKVKHLYYFSFFLGLIALIRPTEIFVVIFPLLIYVTDFNELKLRFREIFDLKWKLLIAVIVFLIPILPQLLFWKTYTGHFFFFSYGTQEGFFFLDPKIYSVLFGWRKGWLIYSPIMIFAVIGLIIMCFKYKKIGIAILVYFLINLYFISSWWDWGYGGAFGMRALVQTYAFLIFPFAFFINWLVSIFKRTYSKVIITVIFSLTSCFLCYLNVYQTYQIKNSLLHWDSMTKEAYWYTFLTTDVDRLYLETLFKNPNYEEMRKGNRDE